MSKAFIQKPAPAFTGTIVRDGAFEEVSLKDFLGKCTYKSLLFPIMNTLTDDFVQRLFYPIQCPTEILAFNKALPRFAELNTEVIAFSTDSEYSHLAWANLPRQEGGLGPDLKLPLFADRNLKVSRDYGVLLEDEGIALRGLFLIDPKGTLRQITINDLAVGRSVEETIRLVKAFQFTDEHGEVCPADWNPETNASTIKANPTDKHEYFSAQK